MVQYDYRIIRSSRRTVGIEVNERCEVIVRAPYRFSSAEIERIVDENVMWIERAIHKRQKSNQNTVTLTNDDVARLKSAAKLYIMPRVKYFSEIMGLTPSSVKITSAQTRFGSCNGKDRLCFSYIVMCYSPECIDYVIVHELAHIKHHNHSAAFYALVEKYLPDYKIRQKTLKEKNIKLEKGG